MVLLQIDTRQSISKADNTKPTIRFCSKAYFLISKTEIIIREVRVNASNTAALLSSAISRMETIQTKSEENFTMLLLLKIKKVFSGKAKSRNSASGFLLQWFPIMEYEMIKVSCLETEYWYSEPKEI